MQNMLWGRQTVNKAVQLPGKHGLRSPVLFENLAGKQAVDELRAL